MSISIFIREMDMPAYVAEDGRGKLVLSLTLADGVRYPNVMAAQEAFDGIRQQFRGMRMEMVSADPEESSDPRDIEPMGELEDLEEIPRVPLGALSLFAELKKSSKYHGQFRGMQPVTHVIPASYGDHYCFRVAHNAYRHEDLIFAVQVRGEFMRLDKFIAPKRERQVAA